MRAKEKNKPVSGARLSPVREKRPLGLDDRELVESALALLERIVTVEAAAILRRPISDIDPLRPLSEMGMDSLMAVELYLALDSRFGVDLPFVALIEGSVASFVSSAVGAAAREHGVERHDEFPLQRHGVEVPVKDAPDYLFGENKKPRYTGGHGEIMGDEANTEDELVALARKVPSEKRGTAFDLLRNLVEGARETTGRATAKPHPEKPAATETVEPPAIEWPSEKWDDSDEKAFHKPGAIISYLRRVWKPFIKSTNSLVTREILLAIDGSAARALTRHLRYDELPKDIGILHTNELTEYSAARPLVLLSTPFDNV